MCLGIDYGMSEKSCVGEILFDLFECFFCLMSPSDFSLVILMRFAQIGVQRCLKVSGMLSEL